MSDLLLRALGCEKTERIPVWIMRQAGRYLPEYQRVRKKAGSFMALCKTPELACEVTLQPLARFSLDAAILFSDILTIPDAMGLGLHFIEGEGPRFMRSIRTAQDVAGLGVPDPETDLKYVCDTVRLLKPELQGRVPLIGFCGSPFTIAAYMAEGGASKNGFTMIAEMRRRTPATLRALLTLLAEAVALHLAAQARAGVDVLMLFDTWGGLLNDQDYFSFSLDAIAKIMHQLRASAETAKMPVIVYTRGIHARLFPVINAMTEMGVTAIGLDQEASLTEASRFARQSIALQGNLAPEILRESPAAIQQAVAAVLAKAPDAGYVFNLGAGITPDILPEHVAVMIEAVRAHRQSTMM